MEGPKSAVSEAREGEASEAKVASFTEERAGTDAQAEQTSLGRLLGSLLEQLSLEQRTAILLRESVREGKRIVKRTLANLSSLSLAQAEAIREVLKGRTMHPIEELFEIVRQRAIERIPALQEVASAIAAALL